VEKILFSLNSELDVTQAEGTLVSDPGDHGIAHVVFSM
jgi:hypothetical protein